MYVAYTGTRGYLTNEYGVLECNNLSSDVPKVFKKACVPPLMFNLFFGNLMNQTQVSRESTWKFSLLAHH